MGPIHTKQNLVVILCLLLIIVADLAAISFDPRDADSGVIRIVTEVGKTRVTGTGILVNKNGYVVTNYHVVKQYIDNPLYTSYVLDGGKGAKNRKSYQIEWYSSEHDIAILQVPDIDKTRKPLTFTDSESAHVSKGMRVYSLGFSGVSVNTGEPVLKNGIISIKQQFPLQKGAKKTRMFEHNATINTGNSGSPLLDNCGRVLGMNQSKARSKWISEKRSMLIAEGTFWAIRSSDIIEALERREIPFKLSNGPCSGMVAADSSTVASTTAGSRVWPQVVLFVGLSLSFLILFVLARRLKSGTTEGVSEYIRREMSRVLRSRGLKSSSERTRDVRDGTTALNQAQAKVHGVLAGQHRMKQKRIEIKNRPVVIGRSKEADLRINDERVGRKHALVGWDSTEKMFYVKDMGSVNGTWCLPEGKLAADEKRYIEPGHDICFADISIVFQIEEPEQPEIDAG